MQYSSTFINGAKTRPYALENRQTLSNFWGELTTIGPREDLRNNDEIDQITFHH